MSRKKKADAQPCESEQPAAPEQQVAPEMASAQQPETVAPEVEAATIEDRIVELEQEIEAERAQALRVLADFQNYRRRTEEQKAEIGARAVQGFVAELLPVLDNFERALSAASESQSYEALVSGVEMILRQLRDLLSKHGVEPIEAVGKEFDPNLHDAVMRVPTEDAEENTVLEELQRGYVMGARVIRPAMVKVAARP